MGGVLGQFALLDVPDGEALEIFRSVGLPATALQQPDFPISLERELAVCLAIACRPQETRSPLRRIVEIRDQLGIEMLGVLGMAAGSLVMHMLTCGAAAMEMFDHEEGSRAYRLACLIPTPAVLGVFLW